MDGAIAEYTKAIELRPAYGGNYTWRADAKKLRGDLDGAIADYTKGIEVEPDSAHYYVFRGRIRQAKGDLDGAIADFTKSIELSPRNESAPAYFDRAAARQAKGDLDGANADNATAAKVALAEQAELARWTRRLNTGRTDPSDPPFSTLPRKQVAVLKLIRLTVLTVDRVPPPHGSINSIKLEPGKHAIKFATPSADVVTRDVTIKVATPSADVVTKDVTLDAGKTYIASFGPVIMATTASGASGPLTGRNWDVVITRK